MELVHQQTKQNQVVIRRVLFVFIYLVFFLWCWEKLALKLSVKYLLRTCFVFSTTFCVTLLCNLTFQGEFRKKWVVIKLFEKWLFEMKMS